MPYATNELMYSHTPHTCVPDHILINVFIKITNFFVLASRRDAKGCSSGCFVLGYRVYVNGVSQISMDGPMSREVTVQCPHPNSNHKLAVHVR